MQKKLPAHKIFNLIGHKAIAAMAGIAKRSDWDKPPRGSRFYRATSMIKALFLYYIKGMKSLAAL